MCGRYASARKRQDLLEEFRIDRDRVTDDLEPDYNVAPTKPVYAVLTRGRAARTRAPGRRRGAARKPRPMWPGNCGWCAGAWCRSGQRTRPSAAA